MPRNLPLLGLLIAVFARQSPRPTGTVVVSNMNDNTASLIDASSGRQIAVLATDQAPHEVAVSHDGRTALVSNYGVRGSAGHTITVIDISSARVIRTLDVGTGQRPHGMAFLPGDTLAAVTSESSGAILLVDVREGRVVKRLATNGRGSHMLGVSARGDRVMTGNIADGTIAVIDVATGASRLIPVARQPEGVAISPDGRMAWVGSNRDSVVLVVDLEKGQAVDTIRGFGLPYRTAVSPDNRTAVITDPVKAEIRIIDAATRRERFRIAVPRDSVLATAEVPGSPSPEGVTISRDGRWAFITLQGRNRLATIDLERGQIAGLAPIGNWSDGVAFSPVVKSGH